MGITENLERVRERIMQAAVKAGRSTSDIELVAITKTHPAEKVREALGTGQTLFGESRVQEARAKIPELPSNLRWHFVGHLQKNKIRHALPLFELFHGVDSLALAQEMNRIAAEEGGHPSVLLEVNVAEEGSKAGFQDEPLRAEMESLLALETLRRACPCAACGGEPDVLGHIARPSVTYTDESFRLASFDLIGGYALQPRWADGHSTGIYSFTYLRRLTEALD